MLLAGLFELTQVILATTDIISDVLIAVQFYQEGRMGFFWVCVFILFIAQIAFTTFFMIAYGERRSHMEQALIFIMVFPFAQVVPLLVYLQSFRFRWLDSALETCGLRVDTFDRQNYNYNGNQDDRDPLDEYIRDKIRTQGGFIIEALVESIPQSILQMIYIVVTGHASMFNVFSLTVSMWSIASKGVMLSYCIDRPTFVFNILCCICDVFSVFCTVSWIFYLVPGEPVYMIWPLSTPVHYWASIWLIKEVVITVCMAISGICLAGYVAMHVIRRGNWQCKDGFMFVLVVGFFSLMFFPFMIGVEGLSFALLPLMVFRSLDSNHARNTTFFRRLFSFLWEGGMKGFKERLRVTNRFLAEKYLDMSNGSQQSIGRYGQRYRAPDREALAQALEVQMITEPDRALNPRGFTLARMRSVMGLTTVDFFRELFKAFANETKFRGPGGDDHRIEYYLRITGLTLFFWVLIPLIILSKIFSLLFPLLAYFSLPSAAQALARRTAQAAAAVAAGSASVGASAAATAAAVEAVAMDTADGVVVESLGLSLGVGLLQSVLMTTVFVTLACMIVMLPQVLKFQIANSHVHFFPGQNFKNSYSGAGKAALTLVEEIQKTYQFRQGRIIMAQVLSTMKMNARLPPWLIKIMVDYLPEVNTPFAPNVSLIDLHNEEQRRLAAEAEEKRRLDRQAPDRGDVKARPVAAKLASDPAMSPIAGPGAGKPQPTSGGAGAGALTKKQRKEARRAEMSLLS